MRFIVACLLMLVSVNADAETGEGSYYKTNRAGHAQSVPGGQAMRRSTVGDSTRPQQESSATPAPKDDDVTPLAPPSKSQGDGAPAKPQTPTRALTTVFGSLAVVIGLFILVVWFTRRALPKASTTLPKEVVDVLGRAPLGNRQQMQLVRVGNKLLLLSVTSNGATPLTEVTDPEEVDRLAGVCQRGQSGSVSETFRQVLGQLGGERNASTDDENGSRRRGRSRRSADAA